MTDTDCYAPDAMAQQDPARNEFPSGDPCTPSATWSPGWASTA